MIGTIITVLALLSLVYIATKISLFLIKFYLERIAAANQQQNDDYRKLYLESIEWWARR